MTEKTETANLKSIPGSKPNASPGFSINVILKNSPITGIISPGYIPSILKLIIGNEMPFT